MVLLLFSWFLYTGIVFLFPSIPVQSLHEEGVVLSRLDHAWLLFAHPEWIWEQWTSGLSRIDLLDRIPAVLWSIACAAFYTALGAWGCKKIGLDAIANESRFVRVLFHFLVGYCGLGTCISIARFVLPDHPIVATVLAIAFVMATPAVVARWCKPLACSQSGIVLTSDQQDWSLLSWKRRLTGLFCVGSGLLLFVQSLGAWLPTLDKDVRRDRWSQQYFVPSESTAVDQSVRTERTGWVALEDVAMFWLSRSESSRLQRMEEAQSQEPADSISMQSELKGIIKLRYLPVIAGKWLATLAFDSAVILVAIRIASLQGSLVAFTALFFLIAFPSWMELIRLGRPEVISGAACLGIVYGWLDPERFAQRRVCARAAMATLCLSGPLVWGLFDALTLPVDSQYSVASAALRFFGFSFLYSIPWAATCLIGGVGPRKSLGAIPWGGISVLAFLLLGGMFSQPDRVWIPFTVFLIATFAVGAQSLLSMRGGWLWLLLWGGLGVVSFLNVLVQPGWDNRLLGSLDCLLFEEIDVESRSQNEESGSRGYSRELLRQTIAGDLPVDACILLIGHWDRLDVPQRTIVERVQSERIDQWTRDSFQRSRITHLALIDSSEQGFAEWDDTLERDYRLHLEELQLQGVISKLPVSERSLDLTLFQVNP
jgi:hypothetical protein